MNIVVLAGGLSDERDVSLSSGSQIANALISRGHRVLLIDIYIGVADHENFEDAYHDLSISKYEYAVPKEEPDLELLRKKQNYQKSAIGPHVISICQSADFCFLALHGGIGENGKLQALFDIYGVAYSGSGYAGSLLAMDKGLSKQLMAANGVTTPDWIIYYAGDDTSNIPVPCVVKPNDNGSSIGVELVFSHHDLANALKNACKYSKSVLIEQMVEGREFSVGILGEEALPVIEIIPTNGFYDYNNKYQDGVATEITPAAISDELTASLQKEALKVHKILGLSGYSRIDFMVDSHLHIFCIEANTLPGMTPTSLLPKEAKAKGIDYPELCEKLIELSQ
ncbi:D-alanine-D-alanine ligase [Paenibacillus shirakamiensis]|uniref:D-alanine--D-alanine ligase n=1 Tax=Paenibacillus shirakamiensis TaxID=1265935 RepID=A0ABS4JJ61_9BACL|nr:D-alanine--D-alanine ligase [Paenibacillus shirakamiensis]MBP2001026.1 D-alanine-D-alanine ligase [Paenibacillus shirakamiensis]